jgi:light-regulated signal transduction histidine kinase (bacteriophytochrome)
VINRSKNSSQSFKDLFAVIAVALLVFSLGYFFDFFEWLIELTRRYDAKALDEYVAVLILLLISVSVFSFRRWRELQLEVIQREKAEEAVRILNKELESNVVKLVEANQELDSFNNTVSHDLQTPLMIIGGFTNRLLKIYGHQAEPNAKEMLTIIQMHAQKMEKFIRDLLAFSRSGRQHMKKTEIDMNELTGIVLDEIKPLTDGREIYFDIRELPPAYGDKTSIKQVMTNLFTNAIKFTRQKNPARITVDCMQTNKENVYLVKDNGIGFHQHEGDKLFSLFERLQEHEKIEGTGIGLSIVQRIINRHGGRVWAEGKVNEGATFYFSLLPNCEETNNYSCCC